jgi:HipA-like protein
MKKRTLLVKFMGVDCGLLSYDGNEYTFKYLSSYRRKPSIHNLDQNISRFYRSKKLFMPFDYMIPEGVNLQRMALEAKCVQDDYLSIFEKFGRNSVNGITFFKVPENFKASELAVGFKVKSQDEIQVIFNDEIVQEIAFPSAYFCLYCGNKLMIEGHIFRSIIEPKVLLAEEVACLRVGYKCLVSHTLTQSYSETCYVT